jgi:ammonium transporter, Amt family
VNTSAAYDPVCVILILAVPLALTGLSIMNVGLGRTRSAAHSMLASLTVAALAACVYCLWGFSWEGFEGGPAHSFQLAGHSWNWIAGGAFLSHGPSFDGSRADAAFVLQLFTVALAALIPLSTGTDRWRLSASLISTVLLAGWTYPLFAHWVWGGGWLSQLGNSYGLGYGFLDSGGASTIHVVGGVSALAIAWILGPRLGKYSTGGMSAAIPGYNIVYVLFGCGLMLPGWIALNGAAALLFAGAAPLQIPLIVANTFLSASASSLAAMAITRLRFGKPDASLCANGWVGGLVTSSALCSFATPPVAIFTGLVAGVIVTLAIEALELRLMIDDPGGAISVHGLAGIWGLLAVGLFAHIPGRAFTGLQAGGHGDRGQMLAQLVGIATLLGFVLPMTYCLNWILNRISPQRADSYGERLGMDLHELGGGAYPEFVIRPDEFLQR